MLDALKFRQRHALGLAHGSRVRKSPHPSGQASSLVERRGSSHLKRRHMRIRDRRCAATPPGIAGMRLTAFDGAPGVGAEVMLGEQPKEGNRPLVVARERIGEGGGVSVELCGQIGIGGRRRVLFQIAHAHAVARRQHLGVLKASSGCQSEDGGAVGRAAEGDAYHGLVASRRSQDAVAASLAQVHEHVGELLTF